MTHKSTILYLYVLNNMIWDMKVNIKDIINPKVI